MLRNTTGIVALALAASLVLAGCSTGAAPAAEGDTKPTKTATLTPTKPADPLEGRKSGDAIDAELAATINASWLELTDDKAYPMPDGTFVLIKGGEPLPENVEQAVVSVVKPLAVKNYQAGEYNQASSDALFAEQEAQETATGRKAAYVIHAWSAKPAGGWEQGWSVGGQTAGYTGTSKEQAMAVASDWVDKSPTTRMLVVIDIFE